MEFPNLSIKMIRGFFTREFLGVSPFWEFFDRIQKVPLLQLESRKSDETFLTHTLAGGICETYRP